MGLVDKLKKSLAKTRSGVFANLNAVFLRGDLDQAFYEELEEILISGDVGVETTLHLVENLKNEARQKKLRERMEIKELLQEKLVEILSVGVNDSASGQKPFVIILVGVNGSGKTTSAAKLAHQYNSGGLKVLLVAGDTFRAAAVEQLEIWANRVGVDLIKQQAGSDPAALYFDALESARARKYDLVIGDTAGRLHTKGNLMDELNKVYRVINRQMPGAPHQTLLVIDATMGQNVLAQAKSFNEALPLSGLILTKLDGTAKGGIVIAISDQLGVPVKYVGTGESIDDLIDFDPRLFVETLFE